MTYLQLNYTASSSAFVVQLLFSLHFSPSGLKLSSAASSRVTIIIPDYLSREYGHSEE